MRRVQASNNLGNHFFRNFVVFRPTQRLITIKQNLHGVYIALFLSEQKQSLFKWGVTVHTFLLNKQFYEYFAQNKGRI